MTKCWRLDTPAQTMVIASRNGGMAEIVYWSAPLPENEDLDTLTASTFVSPGGGVLDVMTPVSVCPEASAGFAGHPGLKIANTDGRGIYPLFRFASDQLTETSLGLTFEDKENGLAYSLKVEADPETNVIKLSANLTSKNDICINWFTAPAIPGPQLSDDFQTFTGRWIGEFQINRINWAQGAHMASAPGGRTSHERQPSISLPERGTSETHGNAIGLHLGWSGGHTLVAEELPSGFRQIQFGATGQLGPQKSFETPPLYGSFSSKGLNGVSQSFHEHLRHRIINYADPKRPRPVHYNCWEAVYFNHQPEELKELATRAADLGVERFVLDDGWFGKRDDDTSSLGDWTVDARKWPDGLQPLIDHVLSVGMSFGIWFEPEMINPDSDLFRAHPDWVLGPSDQPTGRNQLVLDLTNPNVPAYLFDAISAILTQYPDIEYIKWDHNRVLPHNSQAQTHALYALLDRLRAAHPNVEIESCSSGGGRIDFGILERTQRIWTSDSNDAAERWKIQRGCSYFFPPEITGSHIGPRVCHTSGRQFPMPFKVSVAGSRAMGLEMDLRELSDAEAKEISEGIASFKARRNLLHNGRLFRLESSDPDVIAEMHVAKDGAEFVLFSGQMQPSSQQIARPLRLSGLDPDATYKINLENQVEIVENFNRGPRNPLVGGKPLMMTGTALMNLGLQLPNSFPDTIWTVIGTRQ